MPRLLQHAADRGGGILAPALREAQERQTRIGRPAGFSGAAIRAFRLVEFSAQAMKLGDLVERGAERRLTRRFAEPLAREQRFVQRIGPHASEGDDFRTVDEALAAIWHQVGLRVAPSRQRLRPLARASHVEQVRARREHAAVDDAGDDRRELAGGGGDHGFVEQRDAALYLTALDEHAAMALPRQAGEVRVAEPLADRCGFGKFVSRLLDVSTHDRVAGLGNQQVAALHAWVAALVEQTCGARQPAGSLRGVGAVHQNRRDARGDAAGATEIPLLNESLVRSYQGRQAVVVFADEVRGRRQFDQLRRGERRLPIALAQTLVGSLQASHRCPAQTCDQRILVPAATDPLPRALR